MHATESVTLLRVLQVGTVAFLVSSMVLYVLFQARHVIIGPEIILTQEPVTHLNQKKVFLAGSTNNISRLWLNDRPIYTDPQGNFKEALILETGYTIATLKAEDRYGRTTMIKREYVYTPTTIIP